MIDRILILDTETTGLVEGSVAIEVAVVLYSLKHLAALRSFASLIYAEANPAENINHIPPNLLAEAPPAEAVWPSVHAMAASADVIVAHNADFDKRFVPAPYLAEKIWVCSQDDLRWPKQVKSRESLITLMLAHGLGVSHAHRASADVDMMARLFTRVGEHEYDYQEMFRLGMQPKALFKANVSYADRELAKAAGFHWDAGTKLWTQKMTIEAAQALKFNVEVINP